MFYSIRHVTRFRYSAPVRESIMELRMQPRSEGSQALRSFQISTNPRAQLYAYTDHLGNAVYHFNVLRAHDGSVVDGDPQNLIEKTDYWTFARDVRSADPNWLLVATGSG